MESSIYQNVFSNDSCVRRVGYSELADIFNRIPDKVNQEYEKWLPFINGLLYDEDFEAKKIAIVAVLRFVENYLYAGRVAREVCLSVVDRCMIFGPEIKMLGQQVLRAFFIAKSSDHVQEALFAGLRHRSSEVVVACLESLRTLTREFGIQTLTTGSFWDTLTKLLEDRDPSVKANARHYTFVVHQEAGTEFEKMLYKLMAKEKVEDLKDLWACLSIERFSCQG